MLSFTLQYRFYFSFLKIEELDLLVKKKFGISDVPFVMKLDNSLFFCVATNVHLQPHSFVSFFHCYISTLEDTEVENGPHQGHQTVYVIVISEFIAV